MDDLSNQPTGGNYDVSYGADQTVYAIVHSIEPPVDSAAAPVLIATPATPIQHDLPLPAYALTPNPDGGLQIHRGEKATDPILVTLSTELVDVLRAYFDMLREEELMDAYY